MNVKPEYGQPCNGCGLCCQIVLCGMATEILGAHQRGPCPFLVERGDRFWCGVIEAAESKDVAFAAHLKWRLGVGVGCQVHEDDIADDLLELSRHVKVEAP